MGLLRKAAVAAVRGEPLSAGPGAAVSEASPARGPGLLRRSITAREKTPGPPSSQPTQEPSPVPRDQDLAPTPLTIELAGGEAVQVPLPIRVEALPAEPEPAASAARRLDELTAQIQTAIASLKSGMELPSRLFTALSSLLGIRKGALLLYDAMRLVYAPWAQRGFDQTTRHRMRISLGANEAWNALANGRPIVLSGAPALAPFQPHFSSREFASVERMILVPFIAEDKLVAVLLITDLESPLATEAELTECLSRAAEAGAHRVQEARSARRSAPGPAEGRPESAPPRDDMTQFLASLSGRTAVLLVSLSLEEFDRQVLAAHEDLDPFRLHEDVQFFLGSFLSDVGKAMAVRPGRYTLALPDFEASGLDVFTHQLSLFLRGLFDGDASAADAFKGDAGGRPEAVRILRTAAWLQGGADLRSLVESLSS